MPVFLRDVLFAAASVALVLFAAVLFDAVFFAAAFFDAVFFAGVSFAATFFDAVSFAVLVFDPFRLADRRFVAAGSARVSAPSAATLPWRARWLAVTTRSAEKRSSGASQP